jgi:sugar phosphate isomerase/epimerase
LAGKGFVATLHKARQMPSNELCLANLTIPQAGPLELVDAAAAGGFDSVNMWLTPPPALAHLGEIRRDASSPVGNAPATRAIRERLDDRGVRLFSGSAGWIGAGFEIAEIAPVLETLAALGGRAVNVVGWDDERERLVQNLVAVCEAAAPFGLRVQFEFMPYSAVKTIDDARALLCDAAPPNAVILVDALHLARSGGAPADVRRLDPARIGSFQLCDAPFTAPGASELRHESVTGRLYPGEGALPLAELLSALPEDVVIEAEMPVARDAQLAPAERARRCAQATRAFLRASVGTA